MLVETIDRLEDEIFQHLFMLSPRMAVSYGLHEYDGRLPDLSRETKQKISSKESTYSTRPAMNMRDDSTLFVSRI